MYYSAAPFLQRNLSPTHVPGWGECQSTQGAPVFFKKVTKHWAQLGCPLTGKWINKGQVIYTKECYQQRILVMQPQLHVYIILNECQKQDVDQEKKHEFFYEDQKYEKRQYSVHRSISLCIYDKTARKGGNWQGCLWIFVDHTRISSPRGTEAKIQTFELLPNVLPQCEQYISTQRKGDIFQVYSKAPCRQQR